MPMSEAAYQRYLAGRHADDDETERWRAAAEKLDVQVKELWTVVESQRKTIESLKARPVGARDTT